jgi:hypothetical protein
MDKDKTMNDPNKKWLYHNIQQNYKKNMKIICDIETWK